ncbi:MAG: LCP family protein [Actinomycetota bacterium]|nr:LCP family protein [Actinomycetota bacterium]
MYSERHVRRGFLACIAAVVCSLVFPGAGHLAIRARLRPPVIVAAALNLMAVLAVVVIAGPVRNRTDLAEVIADRAAFLWLAVALLMLALTRLWSAVDSAWLARPPGSLHTALRVTAAATAAVLVVAGVAPLAVAANYIWQTDRAIETVFSSGEATTAKPTPLSTTTTWAPTTTATAPDDTGNPTTTVAVTTTTTTPVFPGEDRVNVLLLGGDAGPGRWSLRTDSMIVVSIDPDTGDTSMISVPRNLSRIPFPPGTSMAERYPKGFDEIANAVYTRADSHPEWMGGIPDAGAQAIKLGIAQFLGIPIHYYVLVDMAGFVDVVDALGGIDINVTKRVPSGGYRADEKHPVPKWFELGPQHMDGTVALAYARSRAADSDYGRMARQRCVLAGIAAAATPRAIAFGLTDLMGAFGAAVRTDIPRERLDEVSQLVDRYSQAGGLDAVRTLQLAPPIMDPADWDPAEVRALVAEVLNPTVVPVPVEGAPPPLLGSACA